MPSLVLGLVQNLVLDCVLVAEDLVTVVRFATRTHLIGPLLRHITVEKRLLCTPFHRAASQGLWRHLVIAVLKLCCDSAAVVDHDLLDWHGLPVLVVHDSLLDRLPVLIKNHRGLKQLRLLHGVPFIQDWLAGGNHLNLLPFKLLTDSAIATEFRIVLDLSAAVVTKHFQIAFFI